MKRMARVAFMLFILGIVTRPSGATAQDNPACAKYQEPLAYNACLASHGPKATDIGTGGPQDEHTHGAAAPTARSATRSRIGPAWSHAAQRRGRVHMEFRLQ